MLLRCLQANSSFEEEWASLSGQRLQTGLTQGEPPGGAGRTSVTWSCGNMENSNYSVCVEDNTLSTEIPCCPSMFAKTSLTRTFPMISWWYYFALYSGVGFMVFPTTFPDLCSVLPVNVFLSVLSCSTFLQKLSIGRLAWTLRLSQRLYAGAPKRTCWGQLKATRTSLLHFMTLLPAETTRSVSLKVNNEIVLYSVSWTNGMRIFFCYVIVSGPESQKGSCFKFQNNLHFTLSMNASSPSVHVSPHLAKQQWYLRQEWILPLKTRSHGHGQSFRIS